MKKNIGLLIITLIPLPFITSCNDEPDGAKVADKAIIDFDGERLRNIGNIFFEYDQEGRLVEIKGSYVDVEIDYTKNIINVDGEEGNIKFNKQGYITEISAAWDELEEEYGYTYQNKGNGSLKYSYDSDGHLTEISSISKIERSAGDKTQILETNYSTTLKWTDGNLKSAYITGWESENDDKFNESERFDFSYGDEKNIFNQIPFNISNYIYAEEPLNFVASVGLLGKGPVILPTGYEEEYYDEEGSSDAYHLNIQYKLNENGSLHQESSSWGTRAITAANYGYSPFGTRSQSFIMGDHKKLHLKDLFIKNHKK